MFDNACLVIHWICSDCFCLVLLFSWTEQHTFLEGGGEDIAAIRFDLLMRYSGDSVLKSSKSVSLCTFNCLGFKMLEAGMEDKWKMRKLH